MRGKHHIGASSLKQVQIVHPAKRGNPNKSLNMRRQLFPNPFDKVQRNQSRSKAKLIKKEFWGKKWQKA